MYESDWNAVDWCTRLRFSRGHQVAGAGANDADSVVVWSRVEAGYEPGVVFAEDTCPRLPAVGDHLDRQARASREEEVVRRRLEPGLSLRAITVRKAHVQRR